MTFIKILLIFFFLVLPSLGFAGRTYYVDCSAGSRGDGSFSNPWNSIHSVNEHNFGVGDDVYFKVDTTCKPAAGLWVDWSGTKTDHVVIGAYHGNGKFGLNGKRKPVIDGSRNTVPNTDGRRGLISIQGENFDYIDVRDLQIQYSGDYGLVAKFSDNITVSNCFFYRNEAGIVFSTSVVGGSITNNELAETGYPAFDGSTGGAIIEITAMNLECGTRDIVVANNFVHDGENEGIGIYKRACNIIVENNVVRDICSVNIYNARSGTASRPNVIRYNLVYDSTNDLLDQASCGDSAFGIMFDCEQQWEDCPPMHIDVYGNLIAGLSNGFNIVCNERRDQPEIQCYGDLNIYNNSLADNVYNFKFATPERHKEIDDIDIRNNISYTSAAGTNHCDYYTVDGVSWANNLFDDPIGGEAGAGPGTVFGNPSLKKTSGWRALSPGELDGSEFRPAKNSIANNTGMFIRGYNNRISDSDFTANPSIVATQLDNKPNIGAWMENKASTNLSAPKNFGVSLRP